MFIYRRNDVDTRWIVALIWSVKISILYSYQNMVILIWQVKSLINWSTNIYIVTCYNKHITNYIGLTP